MQKKYSTKQQKKGCRKKNKLSYDSLIKFTKKHSQTVKGSTMFPEWWTIQDSNL